MRLAFEEFTGTFCFSQDVPNAIVHVPNDLEAVDTQCHILTRRLCERGAAWLR